eukprot:6405860-Amphidinium_carterae.1
MGDRRVHSKKRGWSEQKVKCKLHTSASPRRSMFGSRSLCRLRDIAIPEFLANRKNNETFETLRNNSALFTAPSYVPYLLRKAVFAPRTHLDNPPLYALTERSWGHIATGSAHKAIPHRFDMEAWEARAGVALQGFEGPAASS